MLRGSLAVACAALLFGNAVSGAEFGMARANGLEADKAQAHQEYAVKAAFLYNFAKFTTWPQAAYADAAAPMRICVLGRDPFGPALDSMDGRRIKDRRVAIARVARLDEALGCQVLFISESERRHVDAIIARLDGRPILTITESADGGQPGGVIQLSVVAEKVRFRINADQATGHGLDLSSKLLSLAERYSTRGLDTLRPQSGDSQSQG